MDVVTNLLCNCSMKVALDKIQTNEYAMPNKTIYKTNSGVFLVHGL